MYVCIDIYIIYFVEFWGIGDFGDVLWVIIWLICFSVEFYFYLLVLNG